MRQLKFIAVAAVTVAVYMATDLAWLRFIVVGHAQTPCPLRGSCRLEPELAGRSDLLLFEDFEDANWLSHWTGVDTPENLGTPTTPVFAGARSLEVLCRWAYTTGRRWTSTSRESD